jgi:glycogen debranching enzyme
MKRVGFLVDMSLGLSDEERAAWKYLSSLQSFRPNRISFQSLNRKSKITTSPPHLLWWHFDSSRNIPPPSLNPEVISSLQDFVRGGGSLFLSLLAAQYVADLGFEDVRPNILTKGAWDEKNWASDYPDIRGFGTFRGHPIFDGLPGGVYTWNPSMGDKWCGAFYDGTLPARGRVVAVDRQYIRLKEERRLITEYAVGKGRILTVGTYFFFNDYHLRFRPHLERFASNCLTYLTHPSTATDKRTYWNFDVRTVTHTQRTGSNPLTFGSPGIPSPPAIQAITRNIGQVGQFFDVGGKRILIAGNEKGGISEIWCHPVRIVRNLRMAFIVGNATPVWSHDLQPRFTATPECIARTYNVGAATIEETIFADLERPSGVIHLRVDSKEFVEIVVTGSVDLRMMWPLSDAATGSLVSCWDEALQAFIVEAPRSNGAALVGCSTPPVEQLAGQFSDFKIFGERLVGIPTNEIALAFALRLRLSQEHNKATIVFAGADQGSKEAERAYRTMAVDPTSSLLKQSKHVRSLTGRATRIETPDPEFNAAYRWALASTDRFFVEVPGLGSSLFAGFGTTERGWNGGHMNSGRPGYAWYFGRDSVWACFALLGCGDFGSVNHVLEFLGAHQDPAGKILHEMTSSGFAHYDAADATPLYILLMGRYLHATGDVDFIKSQFDRLSKAVEFCTSTDTDGDHLIENTNVGHGWVEGGQLFPVHSEHYLASCWAKALEEASFVASAVHRKSSAMRWKTESQKVCRVIEKQFWNEQTQFYNFGKLADGTFNNEKTLLPAVGISFGLADKDRARACAEAYAADNFSADWGTRIVGKDNPLFKPTGYHYGSIWPLFTGWASLAEFKTARPLQGYLHAMNNLLLYNPFAAGTIEEVFHGEIFEPAGVCSHQAWSESMALQPIIDGMLGFEPDATRNALVLRPYFPPDWPTATISNLRLGAKRISFVMKREAGVTTYEFGMKNGKPVVITLQPYLPLGSQVLEIRVNGKVFGAKRKIVRRYDDCPTIGFRLTTKTIVEVRHAGGIALVPPVPRPVPGQQSKGLRVINESWEQARYILTVEGKTGTSYPLTLIDPDRSIQSVDGGRLAERNEARVTVLVEFGNAARPDSYARKEVCFNTL